MGGARYPLEILLEAGALADYEGSKNVEASRVGAQMQAYRRAPAEPSARAGAAESRMRRAGSIWVSLGKHTRCAR